MDSDKRLSVSNPVALHFTSVRAGEDGSLVAASLGRQIYRIHTTGTWQKLNEGLPGDATVNRLQWSGKTLFACTSGGLYFLYRDQWKASDVAIPCYQIREWGDTLYAGTQYGLWCKTGTMWTQAAYSEIVVYDFLHTPHYLILGHEMGISLYDRYTDQWTDFPLDTCVSSLAVFQGHLVGSGGKGELLVGNKKGGFDVVRFGGMFVFHVLSMENGVWVCTDRGLYKMGRLGERIVLMAVRTGFPVTDVDRRGEQFFLATLSRGIQKMEGQMCV